MRRVWLGYSFDMGQLWDNYSLQTIGAYPGVDLPQAKKRPGSRQVRVLLRCKMGSGYFIDQVCKVADADGFGAGIAFRILNPYHFAQHAAAVYYAVEKAGG